jgi:hypothetical protein
MWFRLYNFAPGEMAEWSIAAVLKTADCQRSGGSNPSLSAEKASHLWSFFDLNEQLLFILLLVKNIKVHII